MLRVTSNERPLVDLNGTMPSYNSLISYKVFMLLAERMQFSYTVIPPADMLYGTFANNNWTGMVGQIYRQEVDLGVQAITTDYVRSRATDGSYPIIFDTSCIMIPVPTEDNTLLAPLKPFTWPVWICLIASFLLVSLLTSRFVSRANDFSGCALATLSLFTGQSFYYISNIRGFKSRAIITGCCLAAVIIINAYTTILFSLLTIPTFKPAVHSVQDLVSSSIMPSVAKGTSYDNIFMNATDGIYKRIADRMRENPEALLRKIADAPELVVQGKIAFVLSTRYVESMIMADYVNHKRCRITTAPKDFLPINLGFLLPKKSPLRTTVNRQIMLMHEHGVIDYFHKQIRLQNPCLQLASYKNTAAKIKPLELKKFGSLFILLGAGVFLALFTFLVETRTRTQGKATKSRVTKGRR